MKKVLVSTAVISVLLAASAFATEVSSGLVIGIDHSQVKEKDTSFTSSGTGVSIKWEKMSVYDNNVAFGSDFGFGRTSMDLGENGNTAIYTMSADFKLGYSPLSKLIGYGIVSANYQHIAYSVDPTNGWGYGYGAGVEYKVLDKIAVNLEYKTSKITATGDTRDISYTFNNAGLNLKYIF
ncbi:MAG: outer membrane beta-barrel protein [Sulfurimonas sp.]|jgi:opacity protein-like surface antigen